jgi:hypothetical protein
MGIETNVVLNGTISIRYNDEKCHFPYLSSNIDTSLKVVISLSRNILTIKKAKGLLRLFDAPNCSHFIYSPDLKSVISVVNG